MLLQLLCASLFLSVVATGDDTLYFKPKHSSIVICPDQKGTCPDGSTCCKLNTGKYGCCPLRKAVCCPDHLHCCPNGYKCDTVSQRCNKGALSVKWHLKTPATPMAKTAPTPKTMCPGGKTECPPSNTCCQVGTTKGNYGCCPIATAVCCGDHLHCCPANYQCDEAHKFCVHGDTMLPWVPVNMKSAQPHVKIGSSIGVTSKKKTGIVCPGGKAKCPTATTCCKLKSGLFGCCPMVEATCCSDHIHCCPKGSKCNLQAGTCDSVVDKTSTRMQKKFSAHSLEGVVVCPGGKATCSSGSTCCKSQSGEYECCPMPKAVCCSDHIHCCPSGMTCDVPKLKCNKGTLSVPWQRKTPALKAGINAQKGNTVCPGGGSCPGDSTCCKMQSGEYGCCPMPKAVCCSDHLHCCPSGTTCDVATSTCTKGAFSMPWQKKTPALKAGVNVQKVNIVCPGGESCPDDFTCCKMQSGKYGCCPMPKAVCCSDHLHCCPSGTTCDMPKEKCNKGTLSVPWQRKTPAFKAGLNTQKGNTVCPGGGSCPGDSTCCKMPSGKYGCCPYPKAVCCNDHVSCCPHGTTCDSAQKKCDKAGVSTSWSHKNTLTPSEGGRIKAYSDYVPWMVKLPARPVILGSMQVICPDKKSTCPNGQTCCLLKGGMWGCCPMPKAVCCKDGLHCCPESTTCDVAHGRCNSNSNSLSISWTMVKRTSALTSLTAPPLAVTCPDKSLCPGMSTCCQESSGRYGCCPLVNATCCPDKLHCCPQGFICQADKCVRQTISVPATMHTRHAAKMPVGGSAIKCPDSNMECPDGTTCCEILKTKKYGCCPKPNAVCCADGVHCCPQGTKCDDKAGACVKAIPWFTKVTAHSPSQKSNSVICPDQQHECPDMNTCCRLSTGEWGCCPLPKAVCCKDGQHCCPNGYTCDPTTAVCNPSGGNRVPKAAARLIAAVQGRYRVKN